MEMPVEITTWLENKGVRPTPNRILVMKELCTSGMPLSLIDIEERLPSMDRSSIFRVLTLFLEHDIVHSFEDGRGVLNYELCTSEGKCDLSDAHIHFYCESCRKSFCLEKIPIPTIQIPEGYTPHSVSYVIKGECPDCRKKE